jgi:hypothetical protein
MAESYRLDVKLGSAEFSAEGPEATVKQAYQQFLQAASSLGSASAPPSPHGQEGREALAMGGEVSQDLLNRVFSAEGNSVSLRLLPEGANRAADAAILLMYGFRKLLGQQEVPITKLNAALRKSGLQVHRLDRFIGVHSTLFMKGGARSGGRYTLNNQGVRQAQSWLRERFT